MNLMKLFEDQRLFNRQIWTPDQDRNRFLDRLRHLALGMFEETGELLGTYEWKSHRQKPGQLPNVSHSHEELVDMFKYWLSLADLADFPMEQLEEMYYAKSRVVQYRYQEEWMANLDGPCVVVDIDNVLADYITGICRFAKEWGPHILKLTPSETLSFVHRLDDLCKKRVWVGAESVGIEPSKWNLLKHEFRVGGYHRRLPVFDDAKFFLDWCRAHRWKILLITARPVDRYPNIFTDTLAWLDAEQLAFDFLWWASNKADRLEEITNAKAKLNVVFAVDDDLTFVKQFASRGIRTFWLDRLGTHPPYLSKNVTVMHSLFTLVRYMTAEIMDGKATTIPR